MSDRKQAIKCHVDDHATGREQAVQRNSFYYGNDYRHLQSLIPAGSSILDLGCGIGNVLQALRPSRAVGVDFSDAMIAIARRRVSGGEFHVGDVETAEGLSEVEGRFDYVLLIDTLGALDDCDDTLRQLHRFCRRETRLVIAQYSWLWEPVFRLAEWLGIRSRQPDQSWLTVTDIESLLALAGYETIRVDRRQLCPKRLLGLGTLINRFSSLPLLRTFCLRNFVVARSIERRGLDEPSVSVIIPCRNERGNVESAVIRTPQMSTRQELIFVEGHSQDGTWEEIERVREAYDRVTIRSLRQPGIGKADAVWAGFEAAQGELLMILDGDLTVPPEALPKFHRVMTSGIAEFAMGTRMVYPVENTAMRFLNYWANTVFAVVFSWILRQRITDTLCGTKVIERGSYERLREQNPLGELDPFGDFDLIFGATRLSLKIAEVPVRYAARSYGETQISRFRHGFMLLRTVVRVLRSSTS